MELAGRTLTVDVGRVAAQEEKGIKIEKKSRKNLHKMIYTENILCYTY